MKIVRYMNLAYSFFYLAHIFPAYAVIFHPSIEVAPDPERDTIYDALDSLQRTARANAASNEYDDDVYLTHTAIDMFGDADNQAIGLERAHNLEFVNLAETLDESAIGIDPIIWVYGLGHLNPVIDDPSWMYDDWANVFILNDANYQRCARTAREGETLVMASMFVIGGNNGPTLSYIAICADGQAWIQSVDEPPTLYDILELPPELLAHMTIDSFQTLDFALLTQILLTSIALDGIADRASANEVSGYAECQRAADPHNAGSVAIYATAVGLREQNWIVLAGGGLQDIG